MNYSVENTEKRESVAHNGRIISRFSNIPPSPLFTRRARTMSLLLLPSLPVKSTTPKLFNYATFVTINHLCSFTTPPAIVKFVTPDKYNVETA